MYQTIQIGAHTLAQGTLIRSFGDGRIEIDAGHERLSGRPVTAGEAPAMQVTTFRGAISKALAGGYLRGGLLATVAAIGLALGGPAPAAAQESVEILNVSYDPTREFYREYNELFNAWWTAQGNAPAAAVFFHIGIGTVALAGYWVALLSRKGMRVHRAAGRVCLATLLVVGLSVGPILFTRPGPFDPGWIVQMVYLTICLGTVSMIAFTAIRFKAEVERFRGPAFRVLGPVLLLLGLVVLAAGIATSDPVAVILSWVGLVFGPAMILFTRHKAALHPRWWLGWHLNAVCALFNAVNGTFLFVAARGIGLVETGVHQQAAFQLATIAVALGLRIWFGNRYGAPLRFGRSGGSHKASLSRVA